MATDTAHAPVRVEGPLASERWASVGFRLDDPTAAAQCRKAAGDILRKFQLMWVPNLVPDVQVMVSELVTNSQRHAGDAYPWASFTLWHPNTWLVLTVHDKGPDAPWAALQRPPADEGENGRGLTLVKILAADHCGEVDFESDGNREQPGKVARVKMLLPDVDWPMPFRDPWTGRIARR